MTAIRAIRSAFICVHLWLCFCLVAAILLNRRSIRAQGPIPPLPDSTGWGVHVLSVARDPRGAIWVGTYGHGIYRLPVGATAWESIRHDTTETSISWDFVQAIGLRRPGPDLVRHARQRLGPLHRRRRHLEELGLQAAGPRVAVRGPVGHRGAGRHHRDRHRRRSPGHHQRRRHLDRPGRRRRSAGQGSGRHASFRCSRASTCAGWRPTGGAGTSPRCAEASGCAGPPPAGRPSRSPPRRSLRPTRCSSATS